MVTRSGSGPSAVTTPVMTTWSGGVSGLAGGPWRRGPLLSGEPKGGGWPPCPRPWPPAPHWALAAPLAARPARTPRTRTVRRIQGPPTPQSRRRYGARSLPADGPPETRFQPRVGVTMRSSGAARRPWAGRPGARFYRAPADAGRVRPAAGSLLRQLRLDLRLGGVDRRRAAGDGQDARVDREDLRAHLHGGHGLAARVRTDRADLADLRAGVVLDRHADRHAGVHARRCGGRGPGRGIGRRRGRRSPACRWGRGGKRGASENQRRGGEGRRGQGLHWTSSPASPPTMRWLRHR